MSDKNKPSNEREVFNYLAKWGLRFPFCFIGVFIDMKHIVITRINFEDKNLMGKYLKICREIFIPSLKKQTNKNFDLGIICKTTDVEFLKKELDINFFNFPDNNTFFDFIVKNGYQIQTRHDCDDWMSEDYIDKIQNEYKNNNKKHSSFLIQAQPKKFMYKTNEEFSIAKYHNKRCSMFLSLCQKEIKNHIFERKHGQMYEITENIISLPEDYVKWVIHGNNKSLKK